MYEQIKSVIVAPMTDEGERLPTKEDIRTKNTARMNKRSRQPRKVLGLFLALLFSGAQLYASTTETGSNIFEWQSLPSMPNSVGLGGTFVGINKGALIVAGGSNFPVSKWQGGEKVFYDDIHVLELSEHKKSQWQTVGKLPYNIAQGASVQTGQGILCIGGKNASKCFDDVFLVKWNVADKEVSVHALPSIPEPCYYPAAAILDNTVYVAGGLSADNKPLGTFWSLNILHYEEGWKSEPTWPGPERFGACMISQADGVSSYIYMFSGKASTGQPSSQDSYLKDLYRFDPAEKDPSKKWTRRADMPKASLLAPVAAVGQSHILAFAGSDGHDIERLDELKQDYQLPRTILGYHTITDTWTQFGTMPSGIVSIPAVPYNEGFILAGGEIAPGKRTAKVYSIIPVTRKSALSVLDYCVLAGYLLLLAGIGLHFSRKRKSTKDYFLANKAIPPWAAGISILATVISSMGFMVAPAKSYSTNWAYVAGSLTIFLTYPIVAHFFIPFFQRLRVTSAYEYLEMRFNVIVRLVASSLYILFQLGRSALVIYIPALALSATTGINEIFCIFVMGVLTTAYTVTGGISAVVWTDVLQFFVLFGGALLCVGYVIFSVEGNVTSFFSIAWQNQKFSLGSMDADPTMPVLWVIVVGSLFARISNYASDQSVVQRYLTTSDETQAKKALWTNTILSMPWSITVFLLGTALYVFYKVHPHLLNPFLRTDGIVPLFISQNLPSGISGLVMAGIFAAAMSSLDSSIHSMATCITVDFFARFWTKPDDVQLLFSRWVTVILGVVATIAACLLAACDTKSLWDSYIAFMGLLVGPMAGFFILGIFTKRGNGFGAVVGAVFSIGTVYYVKNFSSLNFFLYPVIGIVTGVLIGYLASLIVSDKQSIKGLTIYTIDELRKVEYE